MYFHHERLRERSCFIYLKAMHESLTWRIFPRKGWKLPDIWNMSRQGSLISLCLTSLSCIMNHSHFSSWLFIPHLLALEVINHLSVRNENQSFSSIESSFISSLTKRQGMSSGCDTQIALFCREKWFSKMELNIPWWWWWHRSSQREVM